MNDQNDLKMQHKAQLSLKFSFSLPLAEAFFERSRDPPTHGKSHTPSVVQWEGGG